MNNNTKGREKGDRTIHSDGKRTERERERDLKEEKNIHREREGKGRKSKILYLKQTQWGEGGEAQTRADQYGELTTETPLDRHGPPSRLSFSFLCSFIVSTIKGYYSKNRKGDYLIAFSCCFSFAEPSF